jgi:hypothetical protein
MRFTSPTARPPAPAAAPVPADGPMHEFRQYLAESRQHLDQVARAIRDNGRPGVLETATITIPAVGYLEMSRYRVPYAAIAAANLSAFPVVITSAAAQGSAPGGGQGQMQVPPGTYLAQNMAGQTLTFYGTPGAVITYSVLVNRIQPSAAQLAVPCGTLWTNISGTAGANIAANGASPQFATGYYANLGLLVAVTAAPTGTTPTLTVAVDGIDTAGNAYFLGATAALTAAGTVAIPIGPGTNNGYIVPALAQVTWTLGGTTPDFPAVAISVIGRTR